jgi:hypothetical protein
MSVRSLLVLLLLTGCAKANGTLIAASSPGGVWPAYLYDQTEIIDAGLQTGPIYTRGCGHLLIFAINNQATSSPSVTYNIVDRTDAGYPIAAAIIASSGTSIISWGLDFPSSTNSSWTAATNTTSTSINATVPEFISISVPVASQDSLRIAVMCGP